MLIHNIIYMFYLPKLLVNPVPTGKDNNRRTVVLSIYFGKVVRAR